MAFASRMGAFATLLATIGLSPGLHAAEVWTEVPQGTSGTSLSGTLGSISVNMSSTGSTVASTPSVNPGYNLYDIWDNDAEQMAGGATLYPNGARLWPVSAKGNVQYVIVARPGASAVSVQFSKPVYNPKVLVYSLDNSHVDFSQTRTSSGNPAVISAATNSSAQFVPATQRLDRLPFSPSFGYEGCSKSSEADPAQPSGRGCGVMQFRGYYTELKLSFASDDMRNDGVGFQVGYDPDASAPVQSVPTLAEGGLAMLGLLMASLAIRRRGARERH